MIALMTATLVEDDRDFMVGIFEKYYPHIKHTVFKVTHNGDIQDDLAQDVLIRLIRNINTLKNLNEYQISSYIHIAAKTTAINYIQSQSKKNNLLLFGSTSDISEWVSDNTQYTIESDVEIRMDYQKTMERVKMLSEKEQSLFLLRYQCGLKDKEIAEILDIKWNYVRVYIQRILNKLREEE